MEFEPFSICISENADANIDQGYEHYFYEKKSPQAALNFYEAVLHTFDAIALNPYYQVYYKNFRGLPVHNFPYIVFFEVLEQERAVKILAVFNTHQDTNKYPH